MKKLTSILAIVSCAVCLGVSALASARDAGPSASPPNVTVLLTPGHPATIVTPALADFRERVAAINAQVTTQPPLPPTYNAAIFATYESGDKTSKGHLQADAVINVQLGQFTNILRHKNWGADYGTFAGAAVTGKSSGVAGVWIGKTNIPIADQIKGMVALAASINSGQAPHVGLILGITIALGNSK